jgi:hypothetical protein
MTGWFAWSTEVKLYSIEVSSPVEAFRNELRTVVDAYRLTKGDDLWFVMVLLFQVYTCDNSQSSAKAVASNPKMLRHGAKFKFDEAAGEELA